MRPRQRLSLTGVLRALNDSPWKTRIAAPKQTGFSRWHGDEAARRAVTTNRACYSARRFDADRRANPLRYLDSRGQIFSPNNIPRLTVSDYQDSWAWGAGVRRDQAPPPQPFAPLTKPDPVTLFPGQSPTNPYHCDAGDKAEQMSLEGNVVAQRQQPP